MRWKLLSAAVLAAGLTGCDPDIPLEPGPSEDRLTAGFDPGASPPVVPSPNDLAINPQTGLVSAPVNPAASPAEQEFTRDYLNTLDGFPVSATASATFSGRLDPASVTPQSVQVLDITTQPVPVEGATVRVVNAEEGPSRLVITPPEDVWEKGHRYAVVVLGGASGVKGEDGEEAASTPTFALLRAKNPLATCPGDDVASPGCRPTTSLIPQESAGRLEALRRALSPLLEGLEAQQVNRDDVLLAWTFRITSLPEATFDPANAVIPFPSSLALDPETGRLRIPQFAPGTPAQLVQLYQGLATLDGFSTTAPIVSENADLKGPVDEGELDAATLQAGAHLLNLEPGGLPARVQACLNCASSGQPPDVPEQLQLVPQVPLAERSRHAAFLTSELKTTDGRKVVATPAFALARLSHPLVQDGRSTLSTLDDERAEALEPLRLALQPLLEALEEAGVARRDVALAWGFTTQSTRSTLVQLAGLPGGASLPEVPQSLTDVTAAFKAVMDSRSIPNEHVAAIYEGTLTTANLLSAPNQPFRPDPTQARPEPVRFLLTVPVGTAPAGGWPVTIFGHGLTGSRSSVLAIADALAAAGQATIGIDTLYHGERADCRGSSAVTGQSDNFACADGNTCSATTGRCVASGGGAGAFRTGSDGITPVISGWNILNPNNLFATRDNFRQSVIDNNQLVRVLKSTADGSLASAVSGGLDGSAITYAGQSLGGILGTLFVSSTPAVGHSVLNVPGADPVGIFLGAESFKTQSDQFKLGLALLGRPEGSPGFDQFISIARWILEPADPANAAWGVLNAEGVPEGRNALVQYISDDLTIPNSTTQTLLRALNREGLEGWRPALVSFFDDTEPPLSTRPACGRHAFLLQPAGSCGGGWDDPDTSIAAQTELVTFIKTGQLPAVTALP